VSGTGTNSMAANGLLGLALGDVDATGQTIRVVLKGARDEHIVPVIDDFWPRWDAYLRHERGDPSTSAAWVGSRRGRDQPLTYGTFEAALRQLGQQLGVRVTAHMFRHAFAQAVMNSAGLKVTQELLGHAHLSTTADTYLHVDARAMVDAVAAARRMTQPSNGDRRWAFPYDDVTIAELDLLTSRLNEPDTPVTSA
jgi:site-specific recombinase XerD